MKKANRPTRICNTPEERRLRNNILGKRYKDKHPEKIKAMRVDYVKSGRKNRDSRKWRYDITEEQFQNLFKKQNNKCMICLTSFPKGRNPHIDHDRKCCPGIKSCGKCIRGLLCFTCNIGLGSFKESIKNMLRAAKYLNPRLRGKLRCK